LALAVQPRAVFVFIRRMIGFAVGNWTPHGSDCVCQIHTAYLGSPEQFPERYGSSHRCSTSMPGSAPTLIAREPIIWLPLAGHIDAWSA